MLNFLLPTKIEPTSFMKSTQKPPIKQPLEGLTFLVILKDIYSPTYESFKSMALEIISSPSKKGFHGFRYKRNDTLNHLLPRMMSMYALDQMRNPNQPLDIIWKEGL